MKKILVIIACLACMNVSAQSIKLYKGETLVKTYEKDQVDRVVFGAVNVESITLNKSILYLYSGASETLIPTFVPNNSTDKSCCWISSDTSVAQVSKEGVVTANSSGTATISCVSNDNKDVLSICIVNVNTNNGHEFVDLGLPSGLMWAKTNIGSSQIDDYGDQYQWGEVVWRDPQTCSKESKYKFYKTEIVEEDGLNVSYVGYTKYIMKSHASTYGFNGFYDNKEVLDAEDDIAHVVWGGSWRIPSQNEMNELIEECTWTIIEINGIPGMKVTGPNGNYIFLPAAGTSSSWKGKQGTYWSSTLNKNNSKEAHYLSWTQETGKSVHCGTWNRYMCLTVRAVCK